MMATDADVPAVADHAERCDAYAVYRDVIIDCILPLGHESDHDPGLL